MLRVIAVELDEGLGFTDPRIAGAVSLRRMKTVEAAERESVRTVLSLLGGAGAESD